jgi:hypothetical protein
MWRASDRPIPAEADCKANLFVYECENRSRCALSTRAATMFYGRRGQRRFILGTAPLPFEAG